MPSWPARTLQKSPAFPSHPLRIHTQSFPENHYLQIAEIAICSRRKEKHICLAKSVKSSHAASAVGLSAFTWGAIAKRASAPTTIEQSAARYGRRSRT